MTPKSIYNIIQRKGIDAIIRTYPSATFGPDTNKTIQGSAVNYSIKIIPPYKNRERYKPAVLITSGKGLTGIANYNPTTGSSLSFTIKAGLKLIIASKEWTVIGYTEIKNNTGILLYILEIESGD